MFLDLVLNSSKNKFFAVKDSTLKLLPKNSFQLLNKNLTSLTIKSKVNKPVDYFIIQSTCLLDVLTSQKTCINLRKSKFSLSSKSLIFVAKVNLNINNLNNFVNYLKTVVFAEMSKRHLTVIKKINFNIKINNKVTMGFNFCVNTSSIFPLVDELFYKWNSNVQFSFLNLKN